MLTGTPVNFDDCIDFSLKERPCEVSFDLVSSRGNVSEYIVQYLSANFKWKFSKCVVYCKKHLGLFLIWENKQKRGESIEDANKRLKHILRIIENEKTVVKGAEKKFDYTII